MDVSGYGPWLVVTRKKQGNKNNKKGGGGEPLKAVMNESKIVNSASLFKAGLRLAEEGKRKANGSLEPNKVEPSSSGPTILADQGQRNLKSSREQKGNSIKAFYRDKNQASSSTTSTVQFSSFNASFPSSINLEIALSTEMVPSTVTSSSQVKPVRKRVVTVEVPAWKLMEQHRWIC